MAETLRKEGFLVRVHDEHFKPDEADAAWLASCGRRSWVAITPDRRILKDLESMRAIGANRGRVLFLPQNNKNPVFWASILISNWAQIRIVLANHKPPFIAKLSPNGIWDISTVWKKGRRVDDASALESTIQVVRKKYPVRGRL